MYHHDTIMLVILLTYFWFIKKVKIIRNYDLTFSLGKISNLLEIRMRYFKRINTILEFLSVHIYLENAESSNLFEHLKLIELTAKSLNCCI